MCTDKQLDNALTTSPCWQQDTVTGQTAASIDRYRLPALQQAAMSLSGRERNHLFLNRGGKSFVDVSLVSGMDSAQDGRAFAILDFDRDGLQDVALVNANAPTFNLFRNCVGETTQIRPGNFVAIRFVGGNSQAKPSSAWSCRDGYGAKVLLELSQMRLYREHRCGEGFAAQNSARMVIGVGVHDLVKRLEVQWPSGISHIVSNVPTASEITAYEDPHATPDGTGFIIRPLTEAP